MQGVTLVLLLLYCAACCYAAGQSFDYDNQTAWPGLPGSDCGLSRQSPIDIVAGDTTTRANLIRLQLEGWNSAVSGTMQNTGRSLKFTPASSAGSTVTTNHIGEYTLAQFHLHWGNRTGQGSEHLLNGRRFEAEIHFVHARTSPPSNGTEGDALSVVGVFLHATRFSSITNTVWEKFLNVPQVGKDVSVTGITYEDFLPANRSYFYYEGSLTTPPCHERVEWFVMQNSIPIPEQVLDRLRALPADVNQTSLQARNYRDPQPLNGRQVYRFNSANTLPVISLSLMLILTVAILFISF